MAHVTGWVALSGAKTDRPTRRRPASVTLEQWWGASDYNLVKTNLEALDAAVVALGTGGVGNTGIAVGSGQTTDGSTITLLTLSPAADEAWTLQFYGHAFRPDVSPKLSSHFAYFLTFKRSGSTTTIIGSGQAPFSNGGGFSSGLSFTVDGTDVLVQVTGSAGQTRNHWVMGFGVKGG